MATPAYKTETKAKKSDSPEIQGHGELARSFTTLKRDIESKTAELGLLKEQIVEAALPHIEPGKKSVYLMDGDAWVRSTWATTLSAISGEEIARVEEDFGPKVVGSLFKRNTTLKLSVTLPKLQAAMEAAGMNPGDYFTDQTSLKPVKEFEAKTELLIDTMPEEYGAKLQGLVDSVKKVTPKIFISPKEGE